MIKPRADATLKTRRILLPEQLRVHSGLDSKSEDNLFKQWIVEDKFLLKDCLMIDKQKWKVHHFNKQRRVVDEISGVFQKYYRELKKIFTQLAC